MRVKLLEKVSEDALHCGKEYVVASIEISENKRFYRIFSDIRQSPILFSWDLFEVVAHDQPSIWQAFYSTERKYMEICPPDWVEGDFWEDYFDADPEAIGIFSRDLKVIEKESRGNIK